MDKRCMKEREDSSYLSSSSRICLDEFLKEYSRRSATNYRTNICQYANYICKDIFDYTLEDAIEYRDYLKNRRKNGEITTRTEVSKLCYISSFYTYLVEKGFVEENYFLNITRPYVEGRARVNKIPTYVDLDKILEAVKGTDCYAVTVIVSRMGISSGTVVKLLKEDIFRNDGRLYMFIKGGKGKQDRTIPIPEDVANIIEELCVSSPDNYIFHNSKGARLTQRVLEYAFKKALKEHGLDESITLQSVKDRAIIDMLSTTADKKLICDYTGIKMRRLNSYSGIGVLECPADLVNIRIKE